MKYKRTFSIRSQQGVQRSIYKILYIFGFLIFLAFMVFFWNYSKFEASQKLLWVDEYVWTFNGTCRTSYSDLLLSGGEVGFGSLYFIFVKCSLAFIEVKESDPPPIILEKLRWTSRIAVSAYLVFALLIAHFVFNLKFYWLPVVLIGAFGYLHLDSGGVLWASAESRIYGLWLAFSSFHIYMLAKMMNRWDSDGRLSLTDYILFLFSSILLLYTAKPGIIQVIVLTTTGVRFKKLSVFFERPYIFVTFILLIAAIYPFYLALFKGGYEGLSNKWHSWGHVADFILKHKENPALFMLVCLGWLSVLRQYNNNMSRLIVSQLIFLIVVVAAIHIYKYYFIPRVLIFGHILTLLLVISGARELDMIIEGFNDSKKIILTKMILFSIITVVAIYSSTTFRNILLFQFSDKSDFKQNIPIEQYKKNIDQLIFPICNIR